MHTPAHLAHVRALGATGGDAGEGSTMGKFGDEIAILAAGGTIVATDAVLDGTVDERLRARAAARPPRRAGARDGLLRLLEHRHRDPPRAGSARRRAASRSSTGTSTTATAPRRSSSSDPNVLSISLHQDEHYPPGRGRADVVGEGAARGTNLNIPLPPGGGIAAYGYAFERVVVPALRAFRPELIVVASGFDASAYDPLGRMDLSAEDFRALTAALMEVAAEVCDGRLVMSHEGGYSSFYVPYCGLAVIEQMSGIRSDTDFTGVAPDSHRSRPEPARGARARRRGARRRERGAGSAP